ncbi:MAG TPA: class F sortase [Dehalococcoidia bacterium]|nr:class F sortase [Dehalococcoidia bacterium]
MKWKSTYLVLLLAAGLAAISALQGGPLPQPVQAAGATLSLPSATCSGSNATVSFAWTPPAGATETWIDLSTLDNGFVGGSYQTVGPLSGTASSYTWPGLKTYQPYFWRVGSKLPSGPVASETGVFVVCSEPILLASNPECIGKAEATVTFRWAPSVPATQQQWIDVSTQNTFRTGTFSSYGPFLPDASSFKLDRVQTSTYYYRLNSQLQDGSGRGSITRTFVVACGSGADTDLHHSNDKLVYPALGIVAPVNTRKVGPDGAMLNPEGKDDVVRYDFSSFPGLGGYPGNGGTTALAGHLDYRPYYPAVFYNLTKGKPGDVIEYRRADGTVKKFTVAWVASIPFEQSLSEYLTSTNPESMVLITCDGGFDESLGGYANRAIVYAVAAN